jgi:hypothetical protein
MDDGVPDSTAGKKLLRAPRVLGGGIDADIARVNYMSRRRRRNPLEVAARA